MPTPPRDRGPTLRATAVASLLVTSFLGLAAAAEPPVPATQGPGTPPETSLLVTAARLVDVDASATLERGAVLVRGDRIVAVGREADLAPPAGVERLDLGDVTLLPGLVDAHVHLTWGQTVAGESRPGADAARATLGAGVTTVRNLGSPDGSDLVLRDAVARGELPGPRIVAAGLPIYGPGGVCAGVFGEAGVVRGAEEAGRAAEQRVDAGVDVIKVCAGGGVLPVAGEDTDSDLDEAALAAVVAVAHRHGLRVAAHAQGAGAIATAARAGVDSIEHGGGVDEPTSRWLLERGTILVPTLFRLDRLARAAAAAKREDASAIAAARDATRERIGVAVRLGVRVVAGSDATVVPHGSNAGEVASLVAAGLSPMAAIRAATRDAAELLGLADEVGSLAPGKAADLIAVAGDPTQDPEALRRVVFVMKAGVEVQREGATPPR